MTESLSNAAKLDFHDNVPAREHAADILELTALGPDLFMAAPGMGNHIGTVYGGRLLAQSLLAAMRTVDAMPVTSLHAYFLAPGLISLPLEYRVTRLRDSRRFANRQAMVWQGGRPIFTLMCEFHIPEAGFSHQYAPMPDVPPPEEVITLQRYVADNQAQIDFSAVRNFSGATPIEMRPIAPDTYFTRLPELSIRDFWFRLSSAATIDDPRQHQCLMAFCSDYWLAGSAAIPHVFPTNSRDLLISSLDHAVWFHAPARCDDWLLHHTVSPVAGEGIGFAQGRIFDRTGRLVASTAQECLLRRLGD